MTKLKKSINWRWVLPMLVASLVFTSCKNKKKATEISDTTQVSQEIEEEIESYEEQEDVEVAEISLSATQKLDKYMSAIASSTNPAQANSNIREAMTLFSSPESVVLIEVYRGSDAVDYDEPTTADKYLNYLKDQKKNPAKVQDIVFDSQGKIKELVLRRSY